MTVINGVEFKSVHEDGSQTAEIRSMQAIQYMNREFQHGLPLKVAQTIYAQMVDVLHDEKMSVQNKHQQLSVLIHNLQIRASNALNYDNLFGLACIYFYIPGENPAMWDGAKDAEKYALMKQATPEQQLFFCEKVLEFTPKLTEILDTDLATYLKQIQDLLNSQQLITHQK